MKFERVSGVARRLAGGTVRCRLESLGRVRILEDSRVVDAALGVIENEASCPDVGSYDSSAGRLVVG
jgi:hypothetical protein